MVCLVRSKNKTFFIYRLKIIATTNPALRQDLLFSLNLITLSKEMIK
jgi:hypothetical protein